MTEEWVLSQLDELSRTADYPTKALLHETKQLVLEITERMEQLQGEIDGNLGTIKNGEFFI